MNKWILVALAAAALGFAACGDDDDGKGGGHGANCDALRTCMLACGEENDSCNGSCVQNYPEAAMAVTELATCLQSVSCLGIDCIMDQCGSEVAACGWDRADLEGGVLDDEDMTDPGDSEDPGEIPLVTGDCAEAEACLESCSDSMDPNCLLSCTDGDSAAAYQTLLACALQVGCYDSVAWKVDVACAAEKCPDEHAACGY